MSNFRVGQRVVCVDASDDYLGIKTKLEDGRVYTVEEVLTWGGKVGLKVAGVSSWHITGAYSSSRFRPAVERKTDISIFKALLTPSKQHEVA